MTEENDVSHTVEEAVEGFELTTGAPTTIRLSRRGTVYVIEVEDLLFRHDSAVMLPEAYEQGGMIVGLATLAGFIAALYVKSISW